MDNNSENNLDIVVSFRKYSVILSYTPGNKKGPKIIQKELLKRKDFKLTELMHFKNTPIAKKLYKHVEKGEHIPPVMFKEVAALFAQLYQKTKT